MSAAGWDDPPVPLSDPIVIEAYDPEWPLLFAAQAAAIREALGQRVVAIHHIGSTAVPGMAAKPIIDMLAEIRVPVTDPATGDSLVSLGYVNHGEFGIPGRTFFRHDGPPPVHLHLFPAGHASVIRDLGFRDRLRADPVLRERYAAMKRDLAGVFRDDRPSYSRGKESFILEAAGPRPAERWA